MTLDLQKIAAAKLWLISAPTRSGGTDAERPRDLPYLSQALYALIPVESLDVPRISCDEWWRIYVNAEWLAEATVPEVGAELAHVTWHLLADHAARARSMEVDRATAAAWTTASDLTVAHTLDPESLRPPRLPVATDLALPPARSAEEYFAALSGLPTEPGEGGELEPGCGSGADGQRRTNEIAPDTDLGAVSTFEAREIRRRVAVEYRDHVTKRGTDPGDALRWVEDVLHPETPWEAILDSAVRRAVGWAAGRGDFTYARPSRRAGALPGIILPGLQRRVPRVSLVVDTSGSVDDGLLARSLGEIDRVIDALGIPGSGVTVHSVDAAVHTSGRVRRARDAKLVGAGGTDLRVGLRAAEDERPRPDVVIVVTDGDTPWPANPPPGATVIVALLGRVGRPLPPTPAWAVRVECVLREA